MKKSHKWVPLWEKRKEIGPEYFLTHSELRSRLETRVTSTFAILFKPKVTKFSTGYLQKPSKALLLLIVPLILLLGFIVMGFYGEAPLTLEGIRVLSVGSAVFLLLSFILILNSIFTLLISYFTILYYEDREWATMHARRSDRAIYYEEIDAVVIKSKKMYFYTKNNERSYSYVISTRFIKPVWLLDYLMRHFVVQSSDYRSIVIERKIIPQVDPESFSKYNR